MTNEHTDTKRKRSRLKIFVAILVALLIIALAIRAYWTMSNTESGFSVSKVHWYDATVGWIAGQRVPVAKREPIGQARYWLDETQRVVDAHPNDAETIAGAAMILDRPGDLFRENYMTLKRDFGFTMPEYDDVSIENAERGYEDACRLRCLELANRACEIEPENTQWWQLRALFQFSSDGDLLQELANEPWTEVLAECATHDPDNALYDYLAARHYFSLSSQIEWDDATDLRVVSISDPETFAEGMARIEKAKAKKLLTIGDAGMPANLYFLNEARLPRHEHQHFLNYPENMDRRIHLVRELWIVQQCRSRDKMKNNDSAGAISLCRQSLMLGQQYEWGIDSEYGADFGRTIQKVAIEALMDISSETSGEIEEAELDQLAVAHDQLVLRERIQDRAIANINEKVLASDSQWSWFPHLGRMSVQQAVASTPASIVLLCVLAIAAFLAGRSLRSRSSTKRSSVSGVHWFWNVLLFLLSLSLICVVLGIAPSNVLPEKTTGWIFTAIIFLLGCLLVARLLFRFKFRLKFSLRSMLIGTSLLAVLFGLWTSGLLENFVQLPFELDVSAKREFMLDDALFMPLANGSPEWPGHLESIIQWLEFGGPYVTLALWFCLLMFWFLTCKFDAKSEDEKENRFAAATTVWLQMIVRSTSLLAVALLITYLFMLPDVLNEIEKEHQEFVTFAKVPDQQFPNIDTEMNVTRNDPQQMKELRIE